MMMKCKIAIILSGLLSLVGCNTIKNNFDKNSRILQTIKQLDTVPDTSLGNQAVLKKQDKGLCQIEFTGFYQAGKIVENWAFNNNGLISASTTQMRYAIEISDLNQNAKITSVTSSPFDIKLTDTQQNFEKLKKNFSDHALNRCEN